MPRQPEYQADQRGAEGGPQTAGHQNEPTKTFGQALAVVWQRTWEDPVAFFTLCLAAFTLALVVVSTTQIYFLIRAEGVAKTAAEGAKEAAQAAIEGNRLARDQFTVNVRPWLAVLDIRATEPIIYDGTGCTIGLAVSIKNVGHSPATMVMENSRAFPRLIPRDQLDAVREELFRSGWPLGWGSVLFPDQPPVELHIRRRIERAEMMMAPESEPHCIMTPLIIGCVSYRFAVEAPDVHHTWFAVVIGIRPVPGSPSSPGQIQLYLDRPGLLLAIEHVGISHYPVGNWTPT